MKVGNDLLIAPAIVCGLSVRSGHRKDCEGMHGGVARRQGRDASRGVTEKAYVEQCRGGAEPFKRPSSRGASIRSISGSHSQTNRYCWP
jgi:hypothetical protein